jgi:hypothetical protein
MSILSFSSRERREVEFNDFAIVFLKMGNLNIEIHLHEPKVFVFFLPYRTQSIKRYRTETEQYEVFRIFVFSFAFHLW